MKAAYLHTKVFPTRTKCYISQYQKWELKSTTSYSVPSQELLWKARRPYAFQVCQETPTIWGILSDLLLCIQVNYNFYKKKRMTKFLLTTQALVSFFSWSFWTTASTSWILASLNSSEDPWIAWLHSKSYAKYERS